MGSFFNAYLICTGGAPKQARLRLQDGFRARGYALLPSHADGERRMQLYASTKQHWGALVLDSPEDAGPDEARQLARELGAPVIYAANMDSDALVLFHTDGERGEDLCIGDGEAYEISPETGPGALWDALFTTDADRAAFRAILSRKYVFSEEALHDLAPLLGGLPDLNAIPLDGSFDDYETRPYCSFNLGHKQSGVPFRMKASAPPAFVDQRHVPHDVNMNPFCICCESCGGAGRGVVAEFRAVNYDPDALEMPFATIFHFGLREELFAEDALPDAQAMYERCFFHAVPERCTFADGHRGWIARFPEVPILRGVNPDHPQFAHSRGMKERFSSCFCIYAAICGDAFPVIRDALPGIPECLQPLNERTRVRCYPMENPDGATELEIGLLQYGDFNIAVVQGNCEWNWPEPMPEPYGLRHGKTREELEAALLAQHEWRK